MRLSGKVCIITGTGGSIGRTCIDIVVDGGMKVW
jgi:NAD(P)-dependent dehydrogenase (short-subunit alcohol dehydrogenase family)